MPSKKIAEILHHVRDEQQRLAARFREVVQSTNDVRVEFLSSYLVKQEERLNQVLDSYEGAQSKGFLETWVQFVDETKLQRVADEAALPQGAGTADVIAAALAFDAAVLKLYTAVAEATSAPDVEELFTNLATMEESARRQFARATLDL